MNLFALGLNHNTAPLALREKVAFSSEELDTANLKIRAMLGNPAGGGIKEVAILSTCNRTEIYCAAEDSELASKKLKEFLAESKGVKFNELEEHLYVFLNDDAARHAFRVASGLDSMVLGNPDRRPDEKGSENCSEKPWPRRISELPFSKDICGRQRSPF